MGGFCGVISKEDCVSDLFFGTDYHSHLGTHRGGMCVLKDGKFQRSIHNIQNAPFRSKFEHDFSKFVGRVGMGVISDTDPQPLVMRCAHGTFAIVTVGLITNIEAIMQEMFETDHRIRELSEDERGNLIEETARNLGFDGAAAKEISETIQEVIEATDNGFGPRRPRGGHRGGPGGR